MTSANLRVLVASSDRQLLRQSALLLDQFGYEGICCAEIPAALASIGSVGCDFLIVDHDSLGQDFALLESARRRREAQHVHVCLLYSDLKDVDVEAAMESGVDDFLRKPLSNGEVLARLRAGARYWEFERRSRRQQWRDPLTGLATRGALLEHLKRQLPQRGRARRIALAIFDLDLFEHIAATLGAQASDEIERSVARLVDKASSSGQIAVRLSAGHFAVLLPDHSADKAAKWAEQVRHEISELEFSALEEGDHITVSAGLAAADEPTTPAEVLGRAEEALKEAQDSGRNCLATSGQFADERRAWAELMQSGNPFRATLARDVMTPFTLHLREDETVAAAAALHAQSKLDWLPVLDPRGRLSGMVECRRLADEDGVAAAAEVMIADLAQLSDDATFNAVMDCFVQQEEPVVVILRGGHPDGFIAREQFLALVRPVSADMFFREDEEYSAGTEFLLVPDLAAV